MPRPSPHSWPCSCGRSVPARMEWCHCGAHRDGLPRSRQAQPTQGEGSRAKRLALLALGIVGATIAAAFWYAALPAPMTAPPLPAASPPAPTPGPAADPDAAAEPSGPAWTPDPLPQPVLPGAGPVGPGAQAPAPVQSTPPPAEGPSEMDLLRRKAEQWRGRYRPVAERISRLEAEISQLEAEDARSVNVTVIGRTGDDPSLRTAGERTHERLLAARAELTGARQELAQVEDEARRDGVPSGQLY